MKIGLKSSMKNYLKFSLILVGQAKGRWGGGDDPTEKDGSALDYPSISKILGLPNVWSSDLLVRSMSLNSQTLGCAWESLLDVGFGFGVGFGFSFGAAVGV